MPEVKTTRLLSGLFVRKDHGFLEIRSKILNAIERLHSHEVVFVPLEIDEVSYLLRHQGERVIQYMLSDDSCSFERDYKDDFQNFRDFSLRLFGIYGEYFENFNCYRAGLVVYFKIKFEDQAISFLEDRFFRNIGNFDEKNQAEIRLNHKLSIDGETYNVNWKLLGKEREISGSFDLNQGTSDEEGLTRESVLRIEEEAMKYFNETFTPYVLGE